MLIVAVLLYLDTNIAGNMGQTTGKILENDFCVFTLLYVMVLLYVYPVLAKFYNSIKIHSKNAFLMAIRHLPFTFLMLVICVCPLAIFFLFRHFRYRCH